ncbi:unnamed protein product, partial [Ranitomeya imitator]
AFLQIISELGKLPEDTLLVTLDVNNLYTSIQHTKGMSATRQVLINSHMEPNVISFLLELLEIVLTENFFIFEDTFYVQTQGSAMGSNVAPPYANCFMSVFESDYIYSNALFKSHCILWRRYIDDVFCLWKGTGESLQEFFDQINSFWPELSFTLKFDRMEINFLDTKVIQKSDGTLIIDLYVKDTDRNNLLLYQSCHPKAVKRSIPQSQFERVRRIVSDSTLCSQRLDEMEAKFLQRGYPHRILDQSRRNVSRDSNTRSSVRIPLVHTFHPYMYKLHSKIRRHWHILQESFPDIPEFQAPFLPCFRRPSNLKNSIVRADIGSRLKVSRQAFFYKLHRKCAQCANVLKGPKISHPQTGSDIPIQGFFTCNSKDVVYAIKCPCGKMYSDIRCGKYHLPIPNHFREAGHSVAQLRFLVLEQVSLNRRGGNLRKKLLQREAFWIYSLQSLEPKGLNRDYNLSGLF